MTYPTKEKLLRKKWLIITLFSYILPWVTTFIYSWINQIPEVTIDGLIFGNIFALPILLHCAYRKNGTKFLSFVRFVTIFEIIINAISLLRFVFVFPLPLCLTDSYLCLKLMLFFDVLIFSIWWLRLSQKLHKLNSYHQLAHKVPLDVIEKLEALSLINEKEAYDTAFHELATNWPQFMPFIERHTAMNKQDPVISRRD
jgi:hypothetical protein